MLRCALDEVWHSDWGSVVLSFVPWRDIVTSLAATNASARKHLKANYELTEQHYSWRSALSAGWQRILSVVWPSSSEPFPATHVRELSWHDSPFQTKTGRASARILCPQVRELTLWSDGEQRAGQAHEVSAIMAEAGEVTSDARSDLGLWKYAVDRLAWRCATPRLERLRLAPRDSCYTVGDADFDYVTSVLMSACFGHEAFEPALRHLDLELPLPNNPITERIVAKLASSLHSLHAVVITTKTQPSHESWMGAVESWPELRELVVVSCLVVGSSEPALPFKHLHAPSLHTLRLETNTLAIGDSLSRETQSSLRELYLCCCTQRTLQADLRYFPVTLTHLRLQFPRLELVSLPVGLRWLVLVVCEEVGLKAGCAQIALPQLQRLQAPPACLEMIHAPILREVVWDSFSPEIIPTPWTVSVLKKVRHVTLRACRDVPLSFRPWITRIEHLAALGSDYDGITSCWLECPRLRALHLPFPDSEAEAAPLRAFAHERGYKFWIRECRVDDEE